MDQQPRRREKNVTGESKPIERRGEGLGTGPVGRGEGYSGRGQNGPSREGSSFGSEPQGGAPQGNTPQSGPSYGGPVRRTGGSKKGALLIIIAIIIVVILLSKKGLGGGVPTGNNNTNNVSPSPISLFSGYSDNTVSSGWVTAANTGKLNTDVDPAARAKRTRILGEGKDKVTIMAYICGTDLESKSGMASSDIKEMLGATLNSNVNLIVFTGGCTSWKNNTVSNSVNQIYKVENGQFICLEKNFGADAMTRPGTLTGFIRYCASRYPANRNMLIFWDHGGGSISGFGYDERNKAAGSLTLKGIDDALKAAGVTFDFVGFDACLMGTLESAIVLDKYADYMIGSEETEPGVGWYYTNWLTALAKDTSISTLELGKIIVDDFVSFCDRRCPGQKTTLSVVDLAELSATVPSAFSAFAAETAATINSDNFKTVSDARANTREFAVTSKTDQIDLVHLALNMGTADAKALADTIIQAVKYNKTSSAITNAYGLAIYFPYKKTSKIASAVKAYESLGMDSKYTECVRSFANLEIAGQNVAGSSPNTSPFPSLTGSYSGQSPMGSGDITDLLSLLMGTSGLSDGANGIASLFAGSIDARSTADIIAANQLDTSVFDWKKSGGKYTIAIEDDQWAQIHSLLLNVFYDDGTGYIDMGLDNDYDITEEGELVSTFEGTWLSIDGQAVPYYYIDTFDNGTEYTITGRVPVLLNGERANLILVFDNENPQGYIAGARRDYRDGETETVAKGMEALTEGDKIEFVCDYYSYDGTYQDSYVLGDAITYTGEHTISDTKIDADKCSAAYLITDIYNNEYWTPVIP